MKQSLLSSWRNVNKTLAMTVGSQEEFYVSGGNSRGAFTPADVCQTSSVRLNRFTAHRRGTMLKHVAFLLLFLFALGVGNVWGTEVKDTITLAGFDGVTSNSYTDTEHTGASNKGVAAKMNHWYGSTGQIKVNQGNTSSLSTNNYYVYNSAAMPGNITKVELIITTGSTTANYFQIAKSTSSAISSNQTYNTSNAGTKIGSTNSLQWTFNSSEGIKYFRIGCAKNGGTVKASYIIITYEQGPTCDPLEMSEVTATAGDKQIDLSWSAVAHADSYTVTCKNGNSNAGTIGNVTADGTTRTCTISNLTNGTTYTWSVMPVGSGDYCAENTPGSGSATPNVYYTVTWNNNGSEYTTTQVANGQRPTFPEAPESCDAGEGASTTFYGWATSTWSGKASTLDDNKLTGVTIYTSADDMPTVTGNGVVYNAVFCKGGSSEKTDEITSSDLAATSNSYTDFTGVSGANSDAVYAGQSTKNNGIGLRGTNPAGIVSTTSGGKIKSVVIDWGSNATASRYIDVYGSNSAYSTAADLYNTSTDGDKVGTITYTSSTNYSTTYTFSSDYDYVGIRVRSSATVIASVSFIWTADGDATNFMTTCCEALGTIKGSIIWNHLSVNRLTNRTLNP